MSRGVVPKERPPCLRASNSPVLAKEAAASRGNLNVLRFAAVCSFQRCTVMDAIPTRHGASKVLYPAKYMAESDTLFPSARRPPPWPQPDVNPDVPCAQPPACGQAQRQRHGNERYADTRARSGPRGSWATASDNRRRPGTAVDGVERRSGRRGRRFEILSPRPTKPQLRGRFPVRRNRLGRPENRDGRERRAPGG